MKIILNGNEEYMNRRSNLIDLLTHFNIQGKAGLAVTVNDNVVLRSEWEQTKLKENDRIEIIQAVQGG